MTGSTRSLQLWLREWRQPSFRLLWLALFVAVLTVASITAFTGRLKAVFDDGASRFLGGDQVIESSGNLSDAWVKEAQQLGLDTAFTLEFSTMLNSGDQFQLVAVKAVDAGYPLKGEVGVVTAAGAPSEVVKQGPAQGEVWLAPRLFSLLAVQLGDSVGVGRKQLKVTGLLTKEPDPSFSFMNVAPRVLMNYEDVAATAVAQPGSRLKYRLLLAGDEARLEQFNADIASSLTASERIVSAKDGRPAVSRAIERAERYLLLGGVLGVLLAAVALTVTAQYYAQQQKDTVALLKTLGCRSGQLRMRFASLLLISAVTASILGLGCGLLFEQWAVWAMGDMLPPLHTSLPLNWIWLPLLTLTIVLAAFAWPVFRALAKQPPMFILRQAAANADFQRMLGFSKSRMLSALIGFAALLMVYSGELTIVAAVLVGLAVMIAVAAWLMKMWVKLRPPRRTVTPGALRAGADQLKRRPWSTVPHVLALGSAWALLLTLFLVRTELVDNWRAQIPENAPNHFFINIAPYEVEPMRTMFEQNHIAAAPLYPMVRGRLTHINGEPVRTVVSKEREVGALNRELNLTWMADLSEDNRILSGTWWDEASSAQGGVPGVSIESQLAQRLDVKLGDSLTFQIGGAALESKVQSIRSVQWDSLKPNFYMAFAPGALDGFAATYLTSAYLSDNKTEMVNQVNRQFPTVSVLELDQFVVKVREVIAQVSLAIEALLALIFAAALLVVASLLAREAPSRRAETALFRALGAHRRVVIGATVGEFSLIGAFAGVMGVIVAESVAGFLQYRLFELPFSLHWELWLLAPLISAAATAAYAYWRLRGALLAPPHATLQSGFVE
ncbi:ABC transporter permease [Hahella sp. HN01]|uniref:ABC transporter permease n=1 Tax=Hahella sp. HN01 TaxID=2847262 RepID=UPI001C1F1092|nr:FtsX-like permease family protein [Hahella sp. HN01]MBU6952392.1 FtsX-like permease family protein [Hahella sp. HN01]